MKKGNLIALLAQIVHRTSIGRPLVRSPFVHLPFEFYILGTWVCYPFFNGSGRLYPIAVRNWTYKFRLEMERELDPKWRPFLDVISTFK